MRYTKKKTEFIYSSLVPSIESFYSIKKNIIKPLKERFLKIKYKANIKIYPFDKEFSLKRLTEILQDKKKTLIIANKKAYASFLYCPRCEDEILCQNCDVPLKVYKKEKEYLECSICKTKYETITRCPECETPLETVGIGIEKVEEYLKKYFTGISYLHEEKDTNIKLTTTILDKDLTTENFERVINIYPDFFLFVQDYKGREKFFRNILYSYIKAEKEFILFTNQQNDISIKAFLNKKLEKFYEDELNIRKNFGYPPFKRYILLTFEKKILDIDFLNELFKIWIKENNLKNVKYKGIFKGYHYKVKGKERAQLLLIDFKNKQALKILHEKCRKLGIKLIIDVDPVQII
ncbi:hypothetical protein [Hydrogenivirga sp. 128-5-R1-1]|uniref:hypothetical protein n=1 Tax=Hydrogenivirga sp. 128-5-R1-1 TaxID=392423 RepID=UPI00015F04D9|nr:hypothetical protein [Hydrogenivirga sp. 128-5-R1-1]EDP74073.1 hypothetical protein HG1285_01201 [Hydrogenivirga sp. 128-5-R1-1]